MDITSLYCGSLLPGDQVCSQGEETEVGSTLLDCLKTCNKDLVTFQDEAVDFIQEEWTTKDPAHNSVPGDVTVEDYTSLASVEGEKQLHTKDLALG